MLAREPDVVLFGSHGAREATLLVSDEEIFASDEFQRRYRPWKLGARSWGWRRLPHDAPDAAPGPSGDDLQSGPGTR